MAIKIKKITAKKFMEMVASGASMRVIDFRGDYSLAVPGTIPTTFEHDIFYEDEAWVQDMLGVEFRAHQPLVLVCEHGRFSAEAAKLFHAKNPSSNLEFLVLKGGWQSYQGEIDRLTRRFRNGRRFVTELSSLETSWNRFRLLVGELLKRRSFWQRFF